MGIPNVTPPVVNPADPTGNTYFDGTYNSINVRTFNDNGEMYGHLVTVVVQNEGTNKGDYVTNKSFFYSPSGGNGLKPGLNYDVLPDVYQANMIIAMNNTRCWLTG